jgi:peptidoglycan hydrolase-like protein with peptidoglycan-binding domain
VHRAPHPSGAAAPPAAAIAPGTGPVIPWPAGPQPGTLPPFPGPGWEPDTPVTNEIVARANYWNPLLWNYSTKTQRKPFVQENFGGEWLTFAAAWHPGDKGAQTYMSTEAWRVKRAAPAAAAPAAAAPAYVPAAAPAAAHVPSLVEPYPGPGAYATNASYITRVQTALAFLGFPPGPIDGKDGPLTRGAVTAFQAARGLTQDGMAGPATAAELDNALRGTPPAAAPAAAPAPAPAYVPASSAATVAPAAHVPALVEPYPGPGAYATNASYITRVQTALGFLGFSPGPLDGKDGPLTRGAVKAFQAVRGLTQDGMAGPSTAAALDDALRQQSATAAA